MRKVLHLPGLFAAIAVAAIVSSQPARAQIAVPPPTGLMATWAGYSLSGQVVGVSLSWNADPFATSYNIYRGTAIVPNAPGASTLIASGVTGTKFYDPGITMGIDTITFYQITAVNNLGQSMKTAPAVAASLPAVQSTIQGVILATPGPIPGFITVQVQPFVCTGPICPDIVVAPVNFLVNVKGVIYESPAGVPVGPFPLDPGDHVVVTGHRVPGSGTPSLVATVVERGVPVP